MKREELLDYTYFVIKHIERGVTPAWLVDKYMDTEQPLPPAEGAGEVLEKHLADLRKADIKPPLRYGVIYNRIIDAMQEFATLHAQKIADKMVEERTREELMAYGKVVRSWGIAIPSDILECSIDEYLKTRDNHE